MAYLVIGGTGFLGSYVVRDLLQSGKTVVCLQRSGVTPLFRELIGDDYANKVKIIQGDVSNTLQVFNAIQQNNIERVIHLSSVLAPVSETQPAYALQANCIGLNNLLEAVRLFRLKRLVWTSSSRAFGRLGEFWREPIGGDDALYMPDDFYGATKALDEFMLKLYFNKFGVDSICIRMALTFGVGKWTGNGATYTRLFKNAALNIPTTIGGAHHITAIQYVEDTSDLICRACDVPATKSRIFNTGEELSMSQLAEIIRKINPQTQVTLEESREAGMVFVAPSHPRLDTNGVRTELGWQPKYSIEGGLRKMFNYFRQQEGMLPL